MPAPPTPPKPLRAAQPTRNIFDAWNSSSTGHQCAENRMGRTLEWRDTRTTRLQVQLHNDRRVAAERAAGSEGKRQLSLKDCLNVGKAGIVRGEKKVDERKQHMEQKVEVEVEEQVEGPAPAEKQIFANLTMYVNGSTYPLISDHKLKRLLVSHGARLSIGLGRRTVTHVILGVPVGARGAGGGLAAGKLQKEIALVRGKSVKYVTAEWVVESVNAGKRLPETRFVPVKLATQKQPTMLGALTKNESKPSR